MDSPLRNGIVAALLLIPCLSPAQATGDFYRPDGRYDSSVPTPETILGYEIGERPTHHAEIVRYCEALADKSPRVVLRRYGTSHEGRHLLYLAISSEANIGRLEEIQEEIATIADPRKSLDSTQLDLRLQQTPAIAYMAYTIHGDELSGSEAALRLAYELATGTTDAIDRLRENLVVLVDPIENPDGRERILSMIDSYQGAIPNPDPDALSHEGFWPWGRANHYLFDLNRDWFALVHPESRGRASILRDWHPQLIVDGHEMGSRDTYLFSPPRHPFNPNWPSGTLDWWERFAADQAGAFDRHGWSYYTRDWHEEFFPGYGSALAVYQGAVGILYEQAGTAGQPVRKPTGLLMRFRDAVAHQFVSSMANLTTAAGNRTELLRFYHNARVEAIEKGRSGPIRAFYIEPVPDRGRAERIASRLSMLGIEVERLASTGTLRDARSFWEDGKREVLLPEGSFRVRLDQPDGLLARAILEPHTLMPDSSLARERERLERQQGSLIYDVTAWSLLLASGLDCWWSPSLDGLSWSPLDAASIPAGGIGSGPAGYGWVFDGTSDPAVVLAAKLAGREVHVRVGEERFVLNGRVFPRGSFLIRREENRADVVDTLAALAVATGVDIVPVETARIQTGPDLGGGRWRLVSEPRIAIAAGQPLNFTSVGAAWHLLDKDAGLRASLIDISRLSEIDLSRYNVLVLPHVWGGADRYRRALGEPGLRALRGWIEEGGTAVALGTGSTFFADSASHLSSVRLRSQALDDFPAPQFGLQSPAIEVLERMQATGLARDGAATQSAERYTGKEPPDLLGIPGPGSPVLGSGLWAMLGPKGEEARRREALSVSASGETNDEGKTDTDPTNEAERHRLRAKIDQRLRRFLPSGAILRVDLDPERWLSYGVGRRVPAIVGRRDALIARDPVTTVGRYAAPASLHLGGLLWPEAVGYLSQTAFLTRERKGRGQVILFANDPNFRGYFLGTERLFLNAVLLGPGLGTRQKVPW